MNYSFLIKQFAILTAVYFIGEVIAVIIDHALPGNVIGMLLMTILILRGVLKLEQVEIASSMLLDNLSLFFVPIAVGIISYAEIISLELYAILFTTIVSTIIVLVITGKTVQHLLKQKNRKDNYTWLNN